MKLASFELLQIPGIAVDCESGWMGMTAQDSRFPGNILSLLQKGSDRIGAAGALVRKHGKPVELSQVTLLPPLIPPRILCVGLNYADHAAESRMELPKFPTIFSRFSSSIVGSGEPLRIPRVSSAMDFEGELGVIIGKPGRYISADDAIEHVAGYTVFNDGSIRDYQLRTTQWMLGKNFDKTGACGPSLVTADAVPAGATGLAIETRLNGQVMQRSNTAQLIFDVRSLIAILSEAMMLEVGDVIATGTPAGVGAARKPPVYMKAGDICEIEIERIGLLSNKIVQDE
jgi:2-keto-4-pentenoate hydratase/2-oxohepta-3-ene-1,7-dioic acid hydratase in catechol pathway